MPDNVDKLFEIMQAKGAASDRDKFRKVFLTPGNKGYKIRKDIYDGLRADGIIDSPTYEDFRRKLRLGGTPTVNKYRQQMFNSVDPNKSRASELTHRAIGQAVRATNNVRKPVVAKVVNRKGKPTGEKFAITPAKTVEDLDREYAQETTKNWENELHDQMADADKDAAKISDMFKSFIGSTDEVGSVWENMTRGGGIAGTPHSVTTNNGILENTEARQILAAGEYNRKRRELLQLEKDSRNGAIFDNHSFFRGMYDAAKDTGFLTGGASDLINAGSLLATKQDLDNGVHTEAGDMLMQQAVKNSDAQSQYGDNQGWMYTGGVITTNMAPFMVQIGSAGFSKGMSNTIGKVVQGAASKLALGTMEKATGMAGAHIANYIGKVTGLTTKAFGKAIQYGIVGAAQANTVGIGNVANDVVNRYTGQVYQDEQGNYKFGTFDSDGKLVHEGGEDFLTSLVKGEAAQTIEFATELAGGGIDAAGTALKNFFTKGGKKIINKYNMENVSKVIDFLLNNKVSKHARYLKAGADRTLGNVELNSIVGESLEEELGIIANTVFTGDNKISDLWDEKQQSQIWGGMLLSIGLMKGAVAPFHAYNAKQYYSYKHKLNKADVNLSQLLGKEKWDELRNKIDATTNKDMPELINKINRDVALGKNRQPVREYIQNLLIMRGYDIGNMLAAKKAVEDKGKGVSVKNMEKNQAYQQGRDAYGYDTHEIQLDQADKQKALAQLLGITEQQLSTMSDEELDNLSGRDDNLDKAIYDYQLSTIRYQGVADNAQDQVDLAAQKAAQAVDMYTDKSRNTIRNATIKAAGGLEDYGVYVINGNIATHDDGSIDVGNSDDMILFYDPTTNTVEHADATRFAELGSEENADEVRNQAVADAKENAIKEITGIIDGVVEVGTQFKTIDADGTEHTYEVLADNGDGTAMITIDGNIPTQLVKGENVNFPVSFEELQKMKDASDQQRLQAAKAQREQMEKERAEQQMQAQNTQAENPAQEDNIQSVPIEDNLDYSDIIREDGKVQMVDVSDKDGNNLFPDAKDVFYIQGNKMRTKFAYIDANGELKTQSFPTGLVKIKTRGEVSVDDYKKYRNMILSAESSAMPESSMIEDNSGAIEADRGGIEVEDNTQPLSEADADNVIAQMESSAENAPELELTPDNWVVEFGEDGIVSTPIGDVKMGENQVAKLFEKGRSKEFGMIKPTLTNPDVIIEVPSHSADGNEERSSSYLFIKTFLGKNGEKVYYFKSVTIKKDGLEISISSHYDRAKRVKEALMKGKLLYRKNDGAQTEQNQPSASVTTSQEDAAGSSENKDTNISANGNENNESLTFEDGTPIPVDESGETDLSQADAAHAAEWYDNNLGEDADDWLDGEIKKAKKVLEQAKNKKLTGTKPSELVASKKEKEAAIADAQARYDSAISIRDSLKERRIAMEENTPEGRKNLIEKARRKFARLKSAVNNDSEAVAQLYKETVGNLLHRLYDSTGIDVTDTIPLTAEEYVASNLGAHSLNYEGTETSKGVKQETGLSREDFAKTQLLAADGKGTTIDDLVHSLWENRPSNLESLDTQDIRNALIGVLNSGFKASEARNYIENLRIAQAENILEEQKKAADNAAFAEENKAESEQQTETAPESEEKAGEDNSDEINDEENEQTNEQTNAPEQNKFPDKLREGSKAIEVPEDATDENPLGLQLSKDKVPFEIKGEKSGETYDINDKEDRKRLVAENSVDDKDILDIDMPKHVHKAIKELCKKMGLKVQFLYMGARLNGWVENGTMYLALDANKATQFVFGHEMTHAIKQKNPEAYKELVKVAMAVTTKKEFEEDLAKIYRIYHNASGYNNIDDFVEEVIADNIGKFINDHDLAQRFVLRLNHPVLATILHAIQKIKGLLYGDPYKSVDALERIVEQAYVKTANGQVTNTETGEDVSFSLRQKPEPKKKGIGYKVFVLKDGKLYPPMVANPDGAATPVGVWLDADAAPIAGESKTGRPQVKQGGKGTQGGSGKLAYRPGWHLGVVPYAIQFNRKDAEGNKTLFPKNFVFAEVEYAADVDYQDEARQEGINPSGKYQHSLAGLKHLPTDGYYMYRTNPNPETDPWVITGAMKVNRILTRAEQAELVKKAGREPQQIQEGDIVTDDVVNSINQEIANSPKFSLKVYHGSGADFTEFDFDHMGEGAGSQAFGWGGYVTSSEEIGKSYVELTRKKPTYFYNGKELSEDYLHSILLNKVGRNNANILDDFLYNLKKYGVSEAKSILRKGDYAYFKDLLKGTRGSIRSGYQNKVDAAELLLAPRNIRVKKYKGNLYEVDIPEDNGSNYLDWDTPITDELIDKVAKALPSLRSFDIKDLKKDRAFDNFYKTISMRSVTDDATFNDDKAASKLLSSLGYTGIKYKAGRNFGGAEEGDTNYVIFKPEDMKITEHTKFSIKTYHGSQASFDKFDHSFMGSGEGAQAYGWGTYVSEVEGIAKAYAKANAKKNAPSRLMYQGKPMTYKTPTIIYQVALDMDKFNISAKEAISKMIDADEKKLASVGDTPFAKMKAKQVQDELKVLKDLNPSDFKINEDYDTVAQDLVDTKSGLDLLEDELKDAKSYVDLYQSRLDEAKEELSKAKESGTGLGVDMYESDVEYYSEQVKRYKQSIKTKESDIKDVKTKVDALQKKLDSMEKPRNLYSVDIPDDTGKNYLDWDGRLPKTYINRVNKALEASGHKTIDTLYPSRVDGKLVGQDLYDRLRSELGSQKAASLLLKDAGFDGVKVIAQRNTGGNKKGMMNYVIFDENNAKITSHTKFSLKDNQGNPLNQDGTLKLDKIKSVDELTDEDFLHPTRNVELPSLPKKIADAIGTEGKPVVIKKNIFERNYMRHKDVTPELSKVIFKSALYNPDLYGQNQKKTRPYNWVLINTKDEKGNNRTVLLEVNPNKDNVEIVHWHFVNDKNLGLIKKQAIREGDQVLILPSEQSEEVGGLSNLTDDLSAAKIDNSSETAKENGEKVDVEEPKTFEEFLNHPSLKFSIKNEEQRKAAEDAYEYASKLRPSKYAQYALVDMSNPLKSPEYYEKKVLADRWRRFYNKAVHNELDDVYKDAWGNYKLFDLDRPFTDQVNEVKGDVPSEFNAPDVVANKNADNESGAEYHEYKQGGLSSVTYEDRYKAFKQREANREKVAGLKKERKETEDSYNSKSKERAEYHKQLMKEYMDKHKMTEEYEIPDDDWDDLRSKSFEKYQDELDSLFNKYKDLDRQIKAVAEPRFSLKDEKTLAGVHNITEEKLRKALKLGGFANPSLAVIDTNKTGHDNFGEISFIAPSALLDKRTGKTAGTWITDAYTQRYPSVEREMSEKGSQKFRDWVDSLEYPSEAKAEIKGQAEDALSNNNAPAWELMYLKEKGIDIKEYDSRIDYRWKEIIRDYPTAEDILSSMQTDPELNEKVTSLAKHAIIHPTWEKVSLEVRRKMYKETGVKASPINPQVRKQTKEIFERDYAPSLLNKNGTPKKSDVKKVVEQMVKEHNDTKKYDFYLSKVKASNYVNKNGLYDDYIRWQENKLDEFGTKNRIFRGYTKDGSRKYVPETLENVSKVMREEADGQTNGSEYTSFGSFIAKLASRVDSTDEMRANKDKLSSNKDKEEFYEKWNEVYYELAKFLYNDVFYGEQRLHDIVLQSDPKKYAKKEYGITLTPTFMKKLDALKNAVQTELKSAYFETKYNRPLRLNEFAAAVVPDNLSEDVRKGIENAGLPMYDYDPNKEGDRSRAFNEAINSSDNIRFSLKSMMEKPEGWKQANKKAIHIAEAIERDPKFSLKNLDGTLIKAGTYFSGGGLVEEGLKGIIDPVVAVEYDEKISGVYRNNFGQHIVTADVRDVDPKELVKQIDGEVEYFHASPVCKNYSQAKSNHAEVELDKETAASTAEFINAIKPKVVTIENVKGYKDSDAMKTITDALDANGYTWDADVYNAADYGGYTNRERLIVRAVRDGKLPEKPKKLARKSGWYEAVADIIPTLTEKKNGVAPWMDVRLKADGIDWRNIDKPLYVMGSAYADGKIPHAFADELLPTLRTKSGDVIVMPDGKVYRAMGRVLARVSGVSDDYKMPFSENLSHTIIGNGIPTQLTEHVIAPLLTGSDPKFSIRTYHGTGASFDKFDLSHALEGEGSESFGHGVYVTNSREIGREYAQRAKSNKISKFLNNESNIPAKYRDDELIQDYKEIARGVFRGEKLEDLKENFIDQYDAEIHANNSMIKEFEEQGVRQDIYDMYLYSKGLKDSPDNKEMYTKELIESYKDEIDLYKKKQNAIRGMKSSDFTVLLGFRYDVNIPDDNGSNYLDWEGTIPGSLDKQKVAEDAYKVVSDNQGFNDFKATPLNDFIAHTLKTYVNTTDVAGRVEKLKSDIKDVIENYVADDDVLALNEYLKDATPDDVLATIWYNDLVRDIKDADLGEDLYRKLSTYVGDNAASQILSDNGLVGIKYPAGMIHGGAKEGDYNYVIFDENNANIVGNTKFSLRGSTPYDKQMEEWMEKNHLEKGAVPMEKPIMKEGENIFDYANRMVEWTRNQNLWKTAPKQTGFQDALAKWKADNGLSPDAYPPVRPHRENYSSEIGYAEDLEEYNKKKELWKSAPKPKDFDLSVDLEDMNKQLRNIRRAVLNQKNYDQRTVKAVTDLVRKMLNIGWGDGLSRGKVGNLLSAAKNATGANDVKKYLDKAMGILAENYLNRLSTAYDNLINTKGARADQSGVIKMGSLDAKGQAFMSEYKKAINMDDKSLNDYIANIEEDSAKNEDNVEMNDYRLAGIQAAIMYKQQIGGNDADISELQRQIGELKNKKDATKEDKDLLKSLEKKLFENKFDRITMYENLLNNIQRMVKESKGRAKEFREEITEHKNEILHRANLDLEGVDSSHHHTKTWKKKFWNNPLFRFVMSSTYTFEQFLKYFGRHHANGEGYLYNYFMPEWHDAADEQQLYNEMNRNALDEKTKELFGKNKFMKLVGIDGKGMKEMDIDIADYSNKETGKRTIHLKQGQMLYIYLVNKETDGEMKLRAMGITEEDVAAIEENLDPRVKTMGEWLQDEYLPECQRRYQATHTKYFGAPMKEVENYFPLAIDQDARNQNIDINQNYEEMSRLAGTSTGAIVTRRVNVIPLDIENADAFAVAFNHLDEMEEWSAYLPFKQDINTLLSYTHFKNQVKNVSSAAYGNGETLWKEFMQTAQIAAGTYRPKVDNYTMDGKLAALAGGIATAKISGRLWTAIKQSQSATVFLPECDFGLFVKNTVKPYGSYKWAKENLPLFRKRIEGLTIGDMRIKQFLDDVEKYHDWAKAISKFGMSANILVDSVTCAVGARSVYETELKKLTKLGYSKEKAEEKALLKASLSYNKTQQSSEGAFLSPMQVDRTYVSAALSLFKNANYAYGRGMIEACRGLAKTYDLWGGKHKITIIESMTRQIMREDGLDESIARAIARKSYYRTFRKSIGMLLNYLTLVPVSWAAYKVLPYLLTGDDDDKKQKMIEDAVLKGFSTSITDNYVIPFLSNGINAAVEFDDNGSPTLNWDKLKYQNLYINPATSDLANIYSMVANQKWYAVGNKIGMLGVQSLIGFNPETLGALYQLVSEGDFKGDNTNKEVQIAVLKAISAPEESIRELYMDELGLNNGDKDVVKKFMSKVGLDGDDITKIPLSVLEQRYAERQINRDNLLSQIFMPKEDFDGYVEKYKKSFEKKIQEKMDKMDAYDQRKFDAIFDTTTDPVLKGMMEKKRTKDANAAADEQIAKEGLNQEKKGKKPSEEAYDAVKMSIDVAEDNAISTYNKVLNKRYAALNDEYNNQTDAMKYIFMSKHPNFKAYKELESEYTTYGKKMKELKEKLVSADGYDAKQTILKQIRAERDKFYELQSKVR